MSLQVFILGLDDGNRRMVGELPCAPSLEVHGLLRADELLEQDVYPLDEYLAKANYELDRATRPPDTICG